MPPRVRFYPDQAQPLAMAVRLIERAYRSGRWVTVCLAPEQAPALARLLWEERPGVFLPNVMADDPLAAETPIVLGVPGQPLPAERPVWVHLARTFPEPLPAGEWLFEVVGRAEADKAPARDRYRRYQAAGWVVEVARGGTG